MEQTGWESEIATFEAKCYELGESKRLGLKGRRFATKTGSIGAFALPKLLRFAARVGIPGLVDLELRASHVHALWELAGELQASSPRLKELRHNRDEWIARHLRPTVPESDERYESFAELVLAVINGAGVRTGWATELGELAEECRAIRGMLAGKRPELVGELRKIGRRDPEVSAASLLMMDLERENVDRMVQAAGPYLMSIEHDGVVLRDAPHEVEVAVAAAASWPVHRTSYPKSREEYLAMARAKDPWLDWGAESKLRWADAMAARRSCERLLNPPEGTMTRRGRRGIAPTS